MVDRAARGRIAGSWNPWTTTPHIRPACAWPGGGSWSWAVARIRQRTDPRAPLGLAPEGVVVVSPRVTPAIEGQVLAGEVAWVERGFADEDLANTWYVIAATDDPDVNEQVSKAAEVERVFCVRSDDGTSATAWTPAVGRYDGLTLAVLGRREPRRTAASPTRSSPPSTRGPSPPASGGPPCPASRWSAADRAIPT